MKELEKLFLIDTAEEHKATSLQTFYADLKEISDDGKLFYIDRHPVRIKIWKVDKEKEGFLRA